MDSYRLVRSLIYRPEIGFELAVGESSEELEREIRQSLIDALAEEGLTAELGLDDHEVGRSAGGTAIVTWILGGGLATFAAVKTIDSGISTLLKWTRAVRKWISNRRDVAALSVETLKLLCLADLAERSPAARPRLDLIRTSAFGQQWGDGTWRLVSPVYVVIPDEAEKPVTHFYLVSPKGDVLHYVETPPIELQDDRFSSGPLHQLTSPSEPRELRPRELRDEPNEDGNNEVDPDKDASE